MAQIFHKQMCPGLLKGADESLSVCQGQAVASAQTDPEPAQQTKLNTLH